MRLTEPPRARRQRFADELGSALAAPPGTLAAARLALSRLAACAAEPSPPLAVGLDVRDDTDPAAEAHGWAQALARQCREALDDLTFS